MAATQADKLLVQQVRDGDSQAWRQMIDRFQGRLIAFVESRIHDRAASEDVVQETFIGFLVSLPHYDLDRELEAYLFTIAAHKLTDHMRKQGRRIVNQFGSSNGGSPLDEVPGSARPASSFARSDERRQSEEGMLTNSLKQLVGEWRSRGDYERLKCMELLIVKGWANKEAAKTLNLSEQAVASFKFQTLSRLKEMARRAGLNLSALGDD